VVLTSCRHHHKKNEIEPRNECFYQFPNNDHHQRLAEWIHAKNSSNYSPFLPYEQELFELEVNLKNIYVFLSYSKFLGRRFS
jgi:hypothetical protein